MAKDKYEDIINELEALREKAIDLIAEEVLIEWLSEKDQKRYWKLRDKF
jgi:hypothetical protein